MLTIDIYICIEVCHSEHSDLNITEVTFANISYLINVYKQASLKNKPWSKVYYLLQGSKPCPEQIVNIIIANTYWALKINKSMWFDLTSNPQNHPIDSLSQSGFLIWTVRTLTII